MYFYVIIDEITTNFHIVYGNVFKRIHNNLIDFNAPSDETMANKVTSERILCADIELFSLGGDLGSD